MLRELARALTNRAIKERRCTSLALLSVVLGLLLTSCKTTGVGFEYERAWARFVLESENSGTIVTMPVSEERILFNPTATLTEFFMSSLKFPMPTYPK